MWIPSNPAYALAELTRLSPMQAHVLTLLSKLPLTELSLLGATAPLYFALVLLTWPPIYVDAPLILFCLQHPSLDPSLTVWMPTLLEPFQ